MGYLAGRWRILGGEATGALNAFVSYFALPVLFFGTLARTPVASVLDPQLMLGFGAAVVATFAVGMLMTRLLSRGGLAAMSLQAIAASWGNVGYMGVPLCIAAFGDQGLPPAMLTVIVTAIVSMVFGVMLIELEVAAGHGPLRTFLRAAFNVARNPLPLSIALGMVFSASGLPMPVPVEKWIDLLGAAAAPCALFAIGLFLSDKSVKSGLVEAGVMSIVRRAVNASPAAMPVGCGSVALIHFSGLPGRDTNRRLSARSVMPRLHHGMAAGLLCARGRAQP